MTAAQIIPTPDWINLNIARRSAIVAGALTPDPVVNATVRLTPYVADASGSLVTPITGDPIQSYTGSTAPAPADTDASGILTKAHQANVELDLSEVVTRADGTKVSVLALVDSIAMAAAVKAAAPSAS